MKATIETDLGTIELELDEKKAPVTVKNFADYAKSGTTTIRSSTV